MPDATCINIGSRLSDAFVNKLLSYFVILDALWNRLLFSCSVLTFVL